MDRSIRLGERDLELGETQGQDPDGEWAGTQQPFRSDMTDPDKVVSFRSRIFLRKS